MALCISYFIIMLGILSSNHIIKGVVGGLVSLAVLFDLIKKIKEEKNDSNG